MDSILLAVPGEVIPSGCVLALDPEDGKVYPWRHGLPIIGTSAEGLTTETIRCPNESVSRWYCERRKLRGDRRQERVHRTVRLGVAALKDD